jgi:hypothetical protein
MRGPVVGNGGFGEVIPPFATRLRGVGAEESVGVSEEGGVDEGFLVVNKSAIQSSILIIRQACK